MKNILYIGAAIAAIYFWGKSRLGNNVKVIFRGISFTGGLIKPRLNLRFGVQNPTDTTAEIRSIVGNVEINGQTVADVSSFIQLKIAANSETIVPIVADPSAIGIVSQIWKYLQASARDKVTVKFNGTANIDGVNIPIESSATI